MPSGSRSSRRWTDFYRLAKSLHPDGLILSNDGYVMRPTDLVSHFGGGLPDLPVVKHEFGEYYCSLPDISLLDKFTGVVRSRVAARQAARGSPSTGFGSSTMQVRPQLPAPPATRQEVPDRARAAPPGRHRLSLLAHRRLPRWNRRGRLVGGGMVRLLLAAQEHHAARRPGHQRAPSCRSIGTSVKDRTLWNDTPRTVDIIVSNYGEQGSRRGPAVVGADAAAKTLASGTERVTVPMGKVADCRSDHRSTDFRPERRARLELVVDLDGAHTNSWSFWSFPRNGLLQQAPRPCTRQ